MQESIEDEAGLKTGPPRKGERAIAATARFVAVAGSIGAGKSSLIAFLHERFGLLPFLERNEDNPFLEEFYRDMRAFPFRAQVWFLARKVRAHQEIRHLGRPAVLDRTVYEDAEVFAAHLFERGLFPPREYATYTLLYRTACAGLPTPDLLIYLRSSPATQRRRIALRGRPSERALDPAYLRGLNRPYRSWVGRWERCPVLTSFQKHGQQNLVCVYCSQSNLRPQSGLELTFYKWREELNASAWWAGRLIKS